MLGRSVLEPSYSRPPSWQGSDLQQATCSFACGQCRSLVTVCVAKLADAAWRWEVDLGPELAAAASEAFRLNAVGRSHDGGFPAVVRADCGGCGASYLAYAGVRETSNSVYSVTIQGAVEVAG